MGARILKTCDARVLHGCVDRTCCPRVQSKRSQHSQSWAGRTTRGCGGGWGGACRARPGCSSRAHIRRSLRDALPSRARGSLLVRLLGDGPVHVVVNLHRDARAVAQDARASWCTSYRSRGLLPRAGSQASVAAVSPKPSGSSPGCENVTVPPRKFRSILVGGRRPPRSVGSFAPATRPRCAPQYRDRAPPCSRGRACFEVGLACSDARPWFDSRSDARPGRIEWDLGESLLVTRAHAFWHSRQVTVPFEN